jgi:hypothetical protein
MEAGKSLTIANATTSNGSTDITTNALNLGTDGSTANISLSSAYTGTDGNIKINHKGSNGRVIIAATSGSTSTGLQMNQADSTSNYYTLYSSNSTSGGLTANTFQIFAYNSSAYGTGGVPGIREALRIQASNIDTANIAFPITYINMGILDPTRVGTVTGGSMNTATITCTTARAGMAPSSLFLAFRSGATNNMMSNPVATFANGSISLSHITQNATYNYMVLN